MKRKAKAARKPYLLAVTTYFEFKQETEAMDFAEQMRDSSRNSLYELKLFKRKPRERRKK